MTADLNTGSRARKDPLLLRVGHHDSPVLVDQAPSHEVAEPLERWPAAIALQGLERGTSEFSWVILGRVAILHSVHIRPEHAEAARSIANGDLDVQLSPDHRTGIYAMAPPRNTPRTDLEIVRPSLKIAVWPLLCA